MWRELLKGFLHLSAQLLLEEGPRHSSSYEASIKVFLGTQRNGAMRQNSAPALPALPAAAEGTQGCHPMEFRSLEASTFPQSQRRIQSDFFSIKRISRPPADSPKA